MVRFFGEYVALRDAVAAGRIGRPAVLRFTRSGSFPIRAPWFGDVERSGGIVFDQMIHDLDIARWLAGEVDQVSAVVRHDDSGTAPVQAGHVTLRHRSGAISLASGVWGAQHVGFTHIVHGRRRRRSAGARFGPRGRDDGPAGYGSRSATDCCRPRDADADPYLDELAAFLDPSRIRVEVWSTPVTARRRSGSPRPRSTSISTGQPVELAR